MALNAVIARPVARVRPSVVRVAVSPEQKQLLYAWHEFKEACSMYGLKSVKAGKKLAKVRALLECLIEDADVEEEEEHWNGQLQAMDVVVCDTDAADAVKKVMDFRFTEPKLRDEESHT